MLVPILLKRPDQNKGMCVRYESFQKYSYLSSPRPPSSARIDSLSSLLLVEVTGGGLGTKLLPPVLTTAVGYPPSPDAADPTLPLDELTGLLAV